MFLVNYSSSSEDESEAAAAAAASGGPASEQSRCLPIPDSVMMMFKDSVEHSDDSSKHSGRIRSFPHQRGNWSTLVYVEYNPEEEFIELTDLLLSHLVGLGVSMTRMLEFHLSLSQTVVLRYHWINPFVQSLKDSLSPYDRFYCVSDKVKIYCNQEKTRTFLGLEVTAGDKHLLELVHEVDKCMEAYDLQTFYKSPSFHISLAWCLGDVTAQLAKHQQELQDIVDQFEDSTRILRVYADQIRCKTGNKLFSFPLQ